MDVKSNENKRLEKKRRKNLLKAKKSRIIIRNVSFKLKEEIIREKFSKFGNIIEVNIPKDSDGKMYGFCFVGFDAIKNALKAIKEMNGKQLLGRTIAVDFALAKKRFQSKNNTEDESNDNQLSPLKEEKNQSSDIEDEEMVESVDNGEYEGLHGSDSDENEDKVSLESKKNLNPKVKTLKLNDASEERTIFVRNLSFLTTAETLNQMMSKFGPTEFAKICVDPFTDHSKGTAFVKFKNKEDADNCLKAFETQENDFCLDGRQLNISLAVTRSKLKSILEKRLTKDKDKRNLYLAKEGLIYPDSPAAETASQSDLAKRLALETRKRKTLQNNLYFVSKTRLCIHNLPENYDKIMLRKLFLEGVDDKKAQIVEARVMFDRKSDKKFGKSKGFGFVEFTEHIHALKALRHLNNNPNIFSLQKRPIVEFSIENKVAINQKKYRKDRNLLNNQQMSAQNNEDLPEESIGYSGVMSRPDKPNHKIKAPKVNRKLGEMQKQLKTRRKKIHKNKIKESNEKRHKIKVEKRKLNKKETKEIEDSHDLHYRKRKNIFKDSQKGMASKSVKKVKWFIESNV